MLDEVGDDERSVAIPLSTRDTGSARCSSRAPRRAAVHAALTDRVRPALEALLAAAIEREGLTREVVETRALRRTDEIKTAVLRAVSHDLRSPLTAIVAAADALASPAASADDVRELAQAIGTRGASGWRGSSTS